MIELLLQSPDDGTWAETKKAEPNRTLTARILLFTQEAPDGHQSRPGKSRVPNINHVLHALKKEVQEQKVTSLALPRLATGVGGLTWEEVQPLIQATLKDAGIPVYVYTTYKKGVAAGG